MAGRERNEGDSERLLDGQRVFVIYFQRLSKVLVFDLRRGLDTTYRTYLFNLKADKIKEVLEMGGSIEEVEEKILDGVYCGVVDLRPDLSPKCECALTRWDRSVDDLIGEPLWGGLRSIFEKEDDMDSLNKNIHSLMVIEADSNGTLIGKIIKRDPRFSFDHVVSKTGLNLN